MIYSFSKKKNLQVSVQKKGNETLEDQASLNSPATSKLTILENESAL